MAHNNKAFNDLLKKLFSFIGFVFLLVFLSQPCLSKHLNTERDYQEKWCDENGGQVEVTMPDKTRCDCLTGEYAVEFDFGEKWAEAIGQSLYYALQTNKKAGIGLIIEQSKDYKYWLRLNSTIMHHNLPIRTWIIKP